MGVLNFLGFGQNKPDVGALYSRIVGRTRHAVFYTQAGVPDTIDGRFDLLVLHVHIILRDFRRRGLGRHPLGQALFDAFFQDMDQGMREAGVGDLGVSKKIRKMAEAFYGRAGAYDEVLGDGIADPTCSDQLAKALAKNFSLTADADMTEDIKATNAAEASEAADAAKYKPLADYAILLETELSNMEWDAIQAGQFLEAKVSFK